MFLVCYFSYSTYFFNFWLGKNVSNFETLRLSLFDWNLLSKNKLYIGFENFIELFQDDQFLDAIINTTAIAFGSMALTIPLSMVFGCNNI